MNSTNSLPRILVVDDSPTQAVEVRQHLARFGFETEIAANGAKALEAVAARRPDIVLADLMMPAMDGLELVRRLKDEHSGLPVILMTAHGSEELAVKALRQGAAGYVAKQHLGRDLARTLEKVLALLRANSNEMQVASCAAMVKNRYVLGPELSPLGPLVSRWQHNLRRRRMFNENTLMRIGLAVREALVNAIEHGNLEADSKLREDDGDTYQQLVRKRATEPPYSGRRVYVTIVETPRDVTFVIRDEGPGFNPATLPDPLDPENLLRASGRGLLLMRSFMDEVEHNATGNEIRLVKRRAENGHSAHTKPAS